MICSFMQSPLINIVIFLLVPSEQLFYLIQILLWIIIYFIIGDSVDDPEKLRLIFFLRVASNSIRVINEHINIIIQGRLVSEF